MRIIRASQLNVRCGIKWRECSTKALVGFFVRYTCSLINQYSKTFSFFNLLNMLIFAQKSLIIFFVEQKSTIWF